MGLFKTVLVELNFLFEKRFLFVKLWFSGHSLPGHFFGCFLTWLDFRSHFFKDSSLFSLHWLEFLLRFLLYLISFLLDLMQGLLQTLFLCRKLCLFCFRVAQFLFEEIVLCALFILHLLYLWLKLLDGLLSYRSLELHLIWNVLEVELWCFSQGFEAELVKDYPSICAWRTIINKVCLEVFQFFNYLVDGSILLILQLSLDCDIVVLKEDQALLFCYFLIFKSDLIILVFHLILQLC